MKNRKYLTTLALMLGVSTWVGSDETAAKRGHFLTPTEFAELGDKSEVQYATTIVKSEADLPVFRHPGLPKGGPLERTPHPQISEAHDGSRSLFSFQVSGVASKALESAEPLFQ